jgi:hypothetical protein
VFQPELTSRTYAPVGSVSSRTKSSDLTNSPRAELRKHIPVAVVAGSTTAGLAGETESDTVCAGRSVPFSSENEAGGIDVKLG